MPKRQARQPPGGVIEVDAPAAKCARVEDGPHRTRDKTAATLNRHPIILRPQHISQPNTRDAPKHRYELGQTAATANTNANGDADCWSNPSPLVLSQACNRHISSAPVYKPLNPSRREIRLVTLAGGQFSDDIRCSLSTVSLDDKPVYEAFSYVWGDPDITISIILNGTSHQVTTNLGSALRHLRSRNRPRVCWIDAICINQKDLLERQKQVLLMGDVYRNSLAVLCWLGEESEDSALAFDAFETWPTDPEIHWNPDETPGIDHRTSGIEYALAVKNLLDRPYFQRLWIVQEMVLGTCHSLICGKRQFPADRLFDLAQCLWAHTGSCPCLRRKHRVKFMRAISMGLKAFCVICFSQDATRLERNQILELLANFWARGCTDPRDKIYGLLGLASDPFRIVPDYTVPATIVYERITLSTIVAYRNLDVLSQVLPSAAVSSTKCPPGLPSWVPDWAAEFSYCSGSRKVEALERWRDICLYDSSGGSIANVRQSNTGRLALRGVLLGTIARLGRGVTRLEGRRALVDYIESGMRMARLHQRQNSSYPGGLKLVNTSARLTYRDAFWMTLCGSILPDFFLNPSESILWEVSRTREPFLYRSFFQTRWKHWRELVGPWLPPRVPVDRAKAELTRFMTQLNRAMAMRKLFVSDTQYGWLGSAPTDAKVGDHVAVLAGGKVPYILRQREVGGERVFQFIGDAYVDGIMDGEGMAMSELEEIVLV